MHTLAAMAGLRFAGTYASPAGKMASSLDRITIEPHKRSGRLCIRGMRITGYEVLDYLAPGMSEAEILAGVPYLELEDIRAALAFASGLQRRPMSVPSV